MRACFHSYRLLSVRDYFELTTFANLYVFGVLIAYSGFDLGLMFHPMLLTLLVF